MTKKQLVNKIAELKHQVSKRLEPDEEYWNIMDAFDKLMLEIEEES